MTNNKFATLLFAASLMAGFVGDASAASKGSEDLCVELNSKSSEASQTISACTTLIESGQLDAGALTAALARRGQAYVYSGRHSRAIEDFDQAILLGAKVAEIFSSRGTAYAKLGLFARSAEDFDRAILLNPQLAPAYVGRGMASLESGDYKRAIEDADTAIRLKPKLAEAYYVRGNALVSLHQENQAIQDFETELRLTPNQADVYYRRGDAYGALGQYGLAARDYNQALRLAPGDPTFTAARDDALANIEVLKSPHSDAAVASPSSTSGRGMTHTPSMTISRTHDCGDYYPILSRELFESGDVLVGYDVDLDGTLSNVHILNSSGSVNLDQAAQLCVSIKWRNRPAMEGNTPVSSPGHEAIVRFEIEMPADGTSFNERGLARSGIGQYERALDDFNEAIRLQPNFVEAFYNRGIARFVTGRYEDAQADFDQALRLNPTYVDASEARDLAEWNETHPMIDNPPPVTKSTNPGI